MLNLDSPYPYLISRWDISHVLEATQKSVRLLPWYQFSASHKAVPIFLTLDNWGFYREQQLALPGSVRSTVEWALLVHSIVRNLHTALILSTIILIHSIIFLSSSIHSVIEQLFCTIHELW
jgi:hypothetical protein